MSLVDMIYPRVCPVCGKIVRQEFALKTDGRALPDGLGLEKLICPHCYTKVPFVKQPVCLRCGVHISDKGREYCQRCEKLPKSFERNLALMDYSDEIAARMMWDIKYNNKREYADFLALEMGRHFARHIIDWKCEAIIPVPVHPSRKRKRGYNQTAVMAKRLGALLDIPVDESALIRTKKTIAQKKLSKEERYQNLKAAFAAGESAGGYRSVLLLDDIYTTGATMRICSNELLEAGVGKVYGVTCCIGHGE